MPANPSIERLVKLPPQVPSTGNALSRIVGRALMRVTGWRFVGEFPDVPRFVCLVAPHTSNWDFFVALAAKWALGLGATWIGKNSIFRWPVAGFLRRIGGVPVDRNSPHGVVHQMVDAFATAPRMVFVLAPEGTRKRVEHWRSGYWHVAHEARVPIVPVGLDYARKTVVIGPPLVTSSALEPDEAQLRAFYATVRGKRPENYYSGASSELENRAVRKSSET